MERNLEIIDKCIDYLITSGAVVGNAQFPTAAVTHAPFTLRPYKFPLAAFLSTVSLAQTFNSLVHRVSRDRMWLRKTLETVSLVISERSSHLSCRLLNMTASRSNSWTL